MTRQLLITAILDLDPNATPEHLAKLTKAELASWLEALEDDEIPIRPGPFVTMTDHHGNQYTLDSAEIQLIVNDLVDAQRDLPLWDQVDIDPQNHPINVIIDYLGV